MSLPSLATMPTPNPPRTWTLPPPRPKGLHPSKADEDMAKRYPKRYPKRYARRLAAQEADDRMMARRGGREARLRARQMVFPALLCYFRKNEAALALLKKEPGPPTEEELLEQRRINANIPLSILSLRRPIIALKENGFYEMLADSSTHTIHTVRKHGEMDAYIAQEGILPSKRANQGESLAKGELWVGKSKGETETGEKPKAKQLTLGEGTELEAVMACINTWVMTGASYCAILRILCSRDEVKIFVL